MSNRVATQCAEAIASALRCTEADLARADSLLDVDVDVDGDGDGDGDVGRRASGVAERAP
ncbi:hypothetical protein [Burkholderia oklahomensis]|uniref:hypothetical protein n=1 Tax=Burkholderia oklahomensis TaxID=342113 RepID=UPI0011982144|nr:hypothetical protein [Burkholderia oklahomensis]QPS39666.1 hypothetical protein I6G57_28030 [Burkholderia oklahomensis]